MTDGRHTGQPVDASARLVAAAEHHSRAAQSGLVTARLWTGALDTAYHAGAAVELIAKALLVVCDERLLAKDNLHDHVLELVLLSRGDSRAVVAKRNDKTVEAQLALALTVRLHPELAKHVTGAKSALWVRNAAVHAGQAQTPAELAETVTGALAFVNAALPLLSTSSTQFWGGLLAEVTAQTAARDTAIEAEARRLVEQARLSLALTREGVSDETWAKIVELLAGRADESEFDVKMRCPSCASTAVSLWSIDVEEEYDHDGPIITAFAQLDGLHCPVCNLRLDADQTLALDLPDLPDTSDVYQAMSERDWEEYDP